MTQTPETRGPLVTGRWFLSLFAVAVVIHFLAATTNWRRGFMVGHEFRQAQTALIAEYIDKQNNFGLYYETPILGKPWAFPLELPVYQWCVVGLKRLLDLKDFEAARIVSLTSFYLTLPALYLLLGSWRIPPARRLLVLLPTLFCPVYIFYARAFLIDPMATLFSAWFLAAFVRVMDHRRVGWLLVAAIAGSLGILIKSLVFAVWLFPAALHGAATLYQEWRERKNWRRWLSTCAWGLGTVVGPYLLFREWIIFTDALKAVHPSAYEFTSTALSQGNFGTFSLASRFSADTWKIMAQRWSEAIAPAWVIGLVLVAGVVGCRRERSAVAGLTGLWCFGQIAFPYAYAFQDYYFYAGSFFLMLAFGFVMSGILRHDRWPLAVRALVMAAPLVVLFTTYWRGYGTLQRVPSDGGSGLTAMLKDMLPEESVIMIVGQDWAAIVPYYSKRRALMVRDTLRYNLDYLEGAINDLDDEDIGALLVSGSMRDHPEIVRQLTRKLGMVDHPLVRHRDFTDVYFGPTHYNQVWERLGPGGSSYPHVELLPSDSVQAGVMDTEFEMTAGTSRIAFPMINAPVRRFQIDYGYKVFYLDSGKVINFHPNASLWVCPRASSGNVTWRFGIHDSAWQKDGDKTDGVDFIVEIENHLGERREIFRRLVQPAKIPGDRGMQQDRVRYDLRRGEQLVFSSRPYVTSSYDWAYLGEITFEE